LVYLFAAGVRFLSHDLKRQKIRIFPCLGRNIELTDFPFLYSTALPCYNTHLPITETTVDIEQAVHGRRNDGGNGDKDRRASSPPRSGEVVMYGAIGGS